jgi:hypothetical protein
MPTATQNHTPPTRRGALQFSAAALFAGLTVPANAGHAAEPDAELIEIGREAAPLVDEFDRHTAMFFALDSSDPAFERVAHAGDQSFDRLKELATQAAPLRAATLDGLAAKAILLRHLMTLEFGEFGIFVSDGTPLADLMWSLTCDLAGRAAA